MQHPPDPPIIKCDLTRKWRKQNVGWKENFLAGKSTKMMTPSKKVIQLASQEAYEPRLHRGIESTSWPTVCFPRRALATSMKSSHLDSPWFQHRLLWWVPDPLLELIKLPISDWISGKWKNKDASKSDYCVNSWDTSEGPVYLDAGFWFRKQICSAGISAVCPQLTVQLSVFWTSNFLNFISHLSHSARLFSIGTESEESGKQHNHFCRYLFQLELRWWLHIFPPIVLYSGKSIYILSGIHWEIINNEYWSYSSKKNYEQE